MVLCGCWRSVATRQPGRSSVVPTPEGATSSLATAGVLHNVGSSTDPPIFSSVSRARNRINSKCSKCSPGRKQLIHLSLPLILQSSHINILVVVLIFRRRWHLYISEPLTNPSSNSDSQCPRLCKLWCKR